MQTGTMPRRGFAPIAALVVLAVPATAQRASTRDVLYVGNSWDGTADVVDPNTFQVLARLNIIPDIDVDTKQEVARIAVGDHPRRMRTGELQVGRLGTTKHRAR